MSITGGQDNFEEDSKMNCLWKEKETEKKKSKIKNFTCLSMISYFAST